MIDYRHEGGREVPYLLQQADGGAVWEVQQEGFAFNAPSFCLLDECAQELIDDLWREGFRPRQHINEASRIEAVTRHLEDMRTIVFDRLKVAAPNSR